MNRFERCSYDLYLPLPDNDGQPFAAWMFRSVQNELLLNTVVSHSSLSPIRNVWETAAVTYHDEIVRSCHRRAFNAF
ncbi:MAG: hypothetical protein FD138_2634 [Planctomycetota bacterium]|nr:MAG: hypothetical protein FD138_2634 [Planctomycetota bacterium]